MFADTGKISFYLYGIFIAITLIALVLAFYHIRKGIIDSDQLDKMIDLFKYSIVSVAIATVTLIVSDLFKEREQDVNELIYFDKYVEDVKKAENITVRLQLAKYLSIVAPSGELKNSWIRYYKSTLEEYSELQKQKITLLKLDSIVNPTPEQLVLQEKITEEIASKEAPLVSFAKTQTSDFKMAKEWEQRGFDHLLKRDLVSAINAFTESENAANQYHFSYEIANFLKQSRNNWDSLGADPWKIIYHKMANDYKRFMSTATRKAFADKAR